MIRWLFYAASGYGLWEAWKIVSCMAWLYGQYYVVGCAVLLAASVISERWVGCGPVYRGGGGCGGHGGCGGGHHHGGCC